MTQFININTLSTSDHIRFNPTLLCEWTDLKCRVTVFGLPKWRYWVAWMGYLPNENHTSVFPCSVDGFAFSSMLMAECMFVHKSTAIVYRSVSTTAPSLMGSFIDSVIVFFIIKEFLFRSSVWYTRYGWFDDGVRIAITLVTEKRRICLKAEPI